MGDRSSTHRAGLGCCQAGAALSLRNADSNGVCAVAHHVLSNFAKRKSGQFLKPVVDCLQGYEPGVCVPPAALTALKSLRKSRPIR